MDAPMDGEWDGSLFLNDVRRARRDIVTSRPEK